MSVFFTLSYVGLWLLVALLAVLMTLMYRQIGLIYLGGRGRADLGGIEIGRPMPSIPVISGEYEVTVDWSAAARGRRGTIAFFALAELPLVRRAVGRPGNWDLSLA